MEAVTQQELGERIADARRSKGWTQGQLAERVGLTQTAVSRIETGTRAVGSLELAELAELLGVSVLDLLRAGQRPILAIAARLADPRRARSTAPRPSRGSTTTIGSSSPARAHWSAWQSVAAV